MNLKSIHGRLLVKLEWIATYVAAEESNFLLIFWLTIDLPHVPKKVAAYRLLPLGCDITFLRVCRDHPSAILQFTVFHWRRISWFVYLLCDARTFLGINVAAAGNLLESYVKAVDSSLAEYQLPQYYQVIWYLFVMYFHFLFLFSNNLLVEQVCGRAIPPLGTWRLDEICLLQLAPVGRIYELCCILLAR